MIGAAVYSCKQFVLLGPFGIPLSPVCQGSLRPWQVTGGPWRRRKPDKMSGIDHWPGPKPRWPAIAMAARAPPSRKNFPGSAAEKGRVRGPRPTGIQSKSHYGEIGKCQKRPKIEAKIAPLQYTTYHWVWPRRLSPLGLTLTACYHFESHHLRTKLLRLELEGYGRTLNPEPHLSGRPASTPNLTRHGRTSSLAAEPMRRRLRPNCGQHGNPYNRETMMR